ncbi:MAG: isopenicillin N synthase family oxygenase, partial [Deltaproteobacteria bacterium]|nr:isopenicillin N synthase family oxygenase [Deltaproteobacteria bacterium]
MSNATIPVVDLRNYHAGGDARRRFVDEVGSALAEVGFFAVTGHGIPADLVSNAYRCAREFFGLDAEVKDKYTAKVGGQRGYTGFGVEHAKDSGAPDLKEFYQIGRVDVGADHPVHAEFGTNVWPAEVPEFEGVLTRYYQQVDALGAIFLEACGEYVGVDPSTFKDMAREGDTIVRVLYYPAIPEGVPAGAVRAAAHEDINLITLLPGAPAEGLELLTREGDWLPIRAGHDDFIVDSGDMLQNVSNGLFRATTHRVINPERSNDERFSMPCFIHPRKQVDLTPRPECVAKT